MNKNSTQVRSLEYVIVANGQEKQQFAVSGHIIAGSTLSKQAKFSEIKMNVEDTPINFETQVIAAFTKGPQPFRTEVREQEQRCVLGFIAKLATQLTGKQQYTGKVKMTKSEEQKYLMKLSIQQKPWFYRQCEEDKIKQMSEMSNACEIARYHKAALNQVHFDI